MFANLPAAPTNNTQPSNLHDNHPDMKPMNSSNSVAKTSSLRFTKAAALTVALVSALVPAVQAAPIVVETNSFSLGLSTLNIQNNVLIVHRSTEPLGLAQLASLTTQLTKGANTATGWWDGVANGLTGAIRSSNAAATAAQNLKGVGVMINEFGGAPIYTTFHGVAVGQFDVLVAFAWEGDADLSGTIDATDQFLLDNNADNHTTGWLNGDFAYAGIVDATSQFLLDNAVALGASAGPPLAADKVTAAPEPGSMALLAVGAIGLLGRRRKTCQN